VAHVDVTHPLRSEPAQRPVRRLLLMFLMCVILGCLGGLLVATVRKPAPLRTRFTPPAERPFDFHLRDQDGRLTSLADARGKVSILAFAYTSCRDLCPALGNTVVDGVVRAGLQGVNVDVISVDPLGDTPARAREWLIRRGIPAKQDFAHYLVGTRTQLRPVWRAFGIVPLVADHAEAEAALRASETFWKANPYHPDAKTPAYPYRHPTRPANAASQEGYPDTGDLSYRGLARHDAGWDFEHSAYVLLVDKHGIQRVGIPFEQLTAASLAHDIRTLRSER
jgi:cytochrome oxidase Cu insertion factor (SCO1/SenC/PrrC family)